MQTISKGKHSYIFYLAPGHSAAHQILNGLGMGNWWMKQFREVLEPSCDS